jgi:hypothetical protein
VAVTVQAACRAAPYAPNSSAAENDHGLAEHGWGNLAYCFRAGRAAYEQKPFWSSTVLHQSFETPSKIAQHALDGGAGDIGGCRIGLCQPMGDAAGTQPLEVGRFFKIWQQD